ncbi:MAG TPA: AAA family ATPase [Chloroflexota bacterium]
MGHQPDTSGSGCHERVTTQTGQPSGEERIAGAPAAKLVGRDAEFALVVECLRAALSRQPRVVLCQGEAGIGKTRLAEELLVEAAAGGALGVWGRTDDSLGSPPYWPWWQALRAIANRIDLRRLADEHELSAHVARLAPDVFGADAYSGQVKLPLSADDRFRQFDAMARLLRHVSEEIPLVIVLEDAHWADEPSLILLTQIVRGLTDERLLLVVNSRDLAPPHGQRLAQLMREPVARQIHLHGLDGRAIRRQLESLLGATVEDADVAQVEAWTGGNPLFVGEVGRAMRERPSSHRSAPLTASLREAVAARTAHLSPHCAEVMRAAAIVGHEFSAPLVARMLQLPSLVCLHLLDEAHRSGIVEPSPAPERYRFVHALVRDAIEADLERSERTRLHRLAADAIEAQHSSAVGPHLFHLARHWAEAALQGDAATAAGWIERAAEEAMRQLAYEEAARLLGQALQVGGTSLTDDDRCRLLLASANAMNLYADLSGRLKACLEAATLARKLNRLDLLATAALSMPPVGQPGFDLATRRLCQEALAGLPPETTALRARTAARFAETFIYLAETEAAEQASQEALQLAEACADPEALAAALRARQVVCAGPDGLSVRAELATRLLGLSRRRGDPSIEMAARGWQIDVCFELGELSRVRDELQVLARCADEIGGPVARFEVLQRRAALAQAQARFADARRLANDAFSVLAPTDHPAAFHTRAGVLGFVGRHVGQDAAALLASGYPEQTETLEQAGLIAAISKAHVLLTAGLVNEAAEVYRSLGPVAGWRPAPHVVLLSYALGVAVAVGLNEPADVALLRDRLSHFRGHHVVSGIGAVAYFGPVELWLGLASRHLGRLEEAITDLEQAHRICACTGAAGFQVEAMYELALALAHRAHAGDLNRARLLLAEAARQAVRLGMLPMCQKIGDLETRLGQRDELPLSRREMEVARLVADGLTNREIAERLCLSERTAQNHVQHILNKLGVANRGQIAVLVATRLSMATE